MDFESLVRGGGLGANGAGAKKVPNDMWGDESPRVSIRAPYASGAEADPPLLVQSLTPNTFSPPITPSLSPNPPAVFSPSSAFHNAARPNPTSRLSTASTSSSRSLGARTVPSSSFNSTIFPQPTPASPPLPALPPPGQQSPSFPSSFPVAAASPPPAPVPTAGLRNFAALQPSRPALGSPVPSSASVSSAPVSNSGYNTGRPNYDLGASSSSSNAPSSIFTSPPPTQSARPSQPPSWNVLPPVSSPAPSPSLPPGFGGAGVLQPKVLAPKKVEGQNFGAWKDFDPLG